MRGFTSSKPTLTYAITETMNMNANGTTPLKTTGFT